MKFEKFLRTPLFYNTFILTLFTISEKDTANEVLLKPSQAYMMEFFAKTIKSSQLLIIFTKKSITHI